MNHLIEKATEHVRKLYEQEGDNRLTFHNLSLTERLLSRAQEAIPDNSEAAEIIHLAAVFSFTGFLFDYKNQAEQSIAQAKDFLEKENFPAEKIGRVIGCLRVGWQIKAPETEEEQIFADTMTETLFGEGFLKSAALQKAEVEFYEKQQLTDLEWAQFRLQQLLAIRYFSPFGKKHFEPLLSQNIVEQKRLVEKISRKKGTDALPGRFENLGARVSQRAIQTFFRANYQMHINLSSLADNKANIMISVNAILISVIISILSYRSLAEANPIILLPAVVFLITGLTSLIFAILSARPKVTKLLSQNSPREEMKKNIVFFGNFIHLDLDQYESVMNEVFRDGSLLVGNMTRDLYHLGKVLDKKYRYLTLSYNVFMAGFIATVVLFFVVLLGG